ncbi:MAG: S41 family peptidase, partial [Myxococcota bacterium]
PPRELSPQEQARLDEAAARDNYGMPVAEIREGNLGYLEVLGFHPPEVAADAVAATMSKLANADVLVIDLRENGGGSRHGVALMSSYLFGDERVHLNDLYNRRRDTTESFFTSPDVPGRRFGPDKPVYVLTSGDTFSAAEEFAYNLKSLERATIVGRSRGAGRTRSSWFPSPSTGRSCCRPHARSTRSSRRTGRAPA